MNTVAAVRGDDGLQREEERTRCPRLTPQPAVSLDTPSWMSHAMCVRSRVRFFGREGSLNDAKAVCARCPVADACRDYAVEHRIEYGVWGGLTPAERKNVPYPGWHVYFAATSDDSLIKIGCSSHAKRRVKVFGLRLLACEPGSFQREGELHRRFAHLRDHGEYFKPEHDLWLYIADLVLRDQAA